MLIVISIYYNGFEKNDLKIESTSNNTSLVSLRRFILEITYNRPTMWVSLL